MKRPADVSLFLRLLDDEERIEVVDSATIGRHLDNDLIVPGEAVADFHARLARAERGMLIASIADAPVRVNGRAISQPTGVAPGDVIEIGHSDVLLEQEGDSDPGFVWQLVARTGSSVARLDQEMLIGRGEDCDLVLADNHISRRHASIAVLSGAVWLRDLGSANGTYVNDERVHGACQLFHGDELRFDDADYQLLGEGGDLTPARPRGETQHRPLAHTPTSDRLETTEIADLSAHSAATGLIGSMDSSVGDIAGAYLVGMTKPIEGRVFRLRPGRIRIGRDVESDVWIDDESISLNHCELNLSVDGCSVTAHRTTNGTWLNGREVLTDELKDGDVLQCAGVQLGFREGGRASLPGSRSGFWIITGAAILLALAGILAWWLLFD